MVNDVTRFNALPHEEKRQIILAIVQGAAEQWGTECMPATDLGDNRVFNMDEIYEWLATTI